jgi:hypothetical protein
MRKLLRFVLATLGIALIVAISVGVSIVYMKSTSKTGALGPPAAPSAVSVAVA